MKRKMLAIMLVLMLFVQGCGSDVFVLIASGVVCALAIDNSKVEQHIESRESAWFVDPNELNKQK